MQALVFNQKYKTPQGLLDAVVGDTDGPPYCKLRFELETLQAFMEIINKLLNINQQVRQAQNVGTLA